MSNFLLRKPFFAWTSYVVYDNSSYKQDKLILQKPAYSLSLALSKILYKKISISQQNTDKIAINVKNFILECNS